jgi:hypothetical protein
MQLQPPTVPCQSPTVPHQNPIVFVKRLDATPSPAVRQPNTGLKNANHTVQPFNRFPPPASSRLAQPPAISLWSGLMKFEELMWHSWAPRRAGWPAQ